ncbi:hypothetical protein Tco_1182475 [Tanacetum coccineum]
MSDASSCVGKAWHLLGRHYVFTAPLRSPLRINQIINLGCNDPPALKLINGSLFLKCEFTIPKSWAVAKSKIARPSSFPAPYPKASYGHCVIRPSVATAYMPISNRPSKESIVAFVGHSLYYLSR